MGLRTFKLLHVQRTKIILIVSQSAFECSPCLFLAQPRMFWIWTWPAPCWTCTIRPRWPGPRTTTGRPCKLSGLRTRDINFFGLTVYFCSALKEHNPFSVYMHIILIDKFQENTRFIWGKIKTTQLGRLHLICL